MNKLKNGLPYLSLIFLCLFGCKGCREKVDPCKNLKPVSADFAMYETPQGYASNLWAGKSYPYCDTVVSTSVTFDADIEDADQYTWHIGSGTYNTKSFNLNFNLSGLNEFPITLIVSKTPDLGCFPTDDGRDTLTKKLVIGRNGSLVNGRFLGSWEGSSDKFVMGIQSPRTVAIDSVGNVRSYFVVNNYDGKGDSTGFDNFEFYDYRYNMAVFNNYSSDLSALGYDAVYIQGAATMLNHNTIQVDYSYNTQKNNPGSPRTNKKFVGTRVP